MADCVRRAWLELDDGRTVALEDPAAGYFCSSLDLGYPDVREVVNPRPGQHGVDDRTQYFGGRVITAEVRALAGARARIDEVASSFAPYVLPAARVTLHYVLDRDGNPERMIRVRGSGYAWPIAGADQREIHLQWMAADPVLYDAAERTVIAWSGSSVSSGRRYPLRYDRTYPPGQGERVLGRIEHAGEVDARPILRIYGPITTPAVAFSSYHPDGFYLGGFSVAFTPGFLIDAGRYVEVDTTAYTARRDGDPTQPVEHNLVWTSLRWPVLAPAPAYTLMQLDGSSTTGISQVQAIWRDGFLT